MLHGGKPGLGGMEVCPLGVGADVGAGVMGDAAVQPQGAAKAETKGQYCASM